MKQPSSIFFLVIFAGWSAFKGLESLIRPASSKLMFSEYGVTFLYYIFILISTIGGFVLCYAILKRLNWSYPLALVWLICGIIYTAFTAIVSLTNKEVMARIMTITAEAKGRPIENIAEFVNSNAYNTSIYVTTVAMIVIMSLFIYKVSKHRHFLNA